MIDIPMHFGFVLDAVSIIVYFILLFSFFSYFKTRQNILLASFFVVPIAMCDLFYNSASVILLFLATNWLGYNINCSLYQRTLNFIISIIPTLVLTTTIGIIGVRNFSEVNANSLRETTPFIIFEICLLIVMVILTIYLFKIVKKHLFNSELFKNRKFRNLFSIQLMINSIVLLIFFQVHRILNSPSIFLLIFMMIYLLLILASTTILIIYSEIILRKTKIEYLESRLEATTQYLTSVSEKNKELRVIKHDIKNALLTIMVLTQQQNDSGTYEYVKNVLDDINSQKVNDRLLLLDDFQKIQNKVVRGVFIAKISEANQKDLSINFESNVIPSYQKNVEKLVKILGILLDNAIEAAQDSANKSLDIVLFNKNNVTKFLIKNSVKKNNNKNLEKIFDYGSSTKGENRGIGLFTVKKIIENFENFKYDVIVSSDSFSFTLYNVNK